MRTSIHTHETRLRQRLHRLAWHVRYHARTDEEIIQVERVMLAVTEGALEPRAAHSAFTALRADQTR